MDTIEYDGKIIGFPTSTRALADQEVAMKTLNLFERYLTLWVALCMGAGILSGKLFPDTVNIIRSMEFGKGSHINIPIAILIWLMIYPMMLKVDFSSILNVGKRPKGLMVTLFVNWVVKPFSMAFFGWLFFQHIFFSWIGPELADQYVAGVIILSGVISQAATPHTRWSRCRSTT
jgi:ACR3 family arsenite transporter